MKVMMILALVSLSFSSFAMPEKCEKVFKRFTQNALIATQYLADFSYRPIITLNGYIEKKSDADRKRFYDRIMKENKQADDYNSKRAREMVILLKENQECFTAQELTEYNF